MPRQLDLTSLRSFVAIADAGGVTRAAGFLNLTQSAVSMQLKRLEEALGVDLMDRAGRGVALTAAGEQLLGYARRMLNLNDEALARLTGQSFEGEVVLGVPSDIVYPAIPRVLRRFAQDYPKMRVTLVSSYTRRLKRLFELGECDVILTTEDVADPGGETLRSIPLIWVGAPGGNAWKQRPLPLAFEYNCIFRTHVQAALDRAGIPWVMAAESETTRSIEASLSADLAVHVLVEGAEPREIQRVAHGGTLPDLGHTQVNLYVAATGQGDAAGALAAMIRQEYAAP
ncbi:transcriptional regulator, LysR family [Gemmobacter megaterium]|uniref:Transcriptional regulator, LysR family n=1 Tax=Gemmobacter megaterium TaxID=1086013 RepID=A0A1N7JZS4_9RHOB|nr:LysR family transcriptional regulator [Gemmobacter megaterium]GGD99728.1 LysR family transcriptional regulator [Gemmobacter megaterium]SIS54828.1 transcriptional regulator, LysR family [Gemmobacter megaterium]